MGKIKNFDWSDKAKEKYFRKAKKQVKEIKGIEIDRDRFTVKSGNEIHVFIKKVSKKDFKKEIKLLMKIENFVVNNDSFKGEYGTKMQSIYFDGYLEFRMEG